MRTVRTCTRGLSWVVAVIAVAPIAGAVETEDDEARHSHRTVVAVSSVSPDFVLRTQFACRTIPPHVWNRLQEAGWRVWAAPTVVDAMPHLRGRRPRGWPDGTTWENSDAVHLPKKQLLVMAESRRTADGRRVTCHRVDGVLRHEIGHAYDLAAGRHGSSLSGGGSFRQAYREDVRSMNGRQRQALRYYLQAGDSGCQETYAEAFAITLGGGSDETHQEVFRSAFRRVLEHISRQIGRP